MNPNCLPNEADRANTDLSGSSSAFTDALLAYENVANSNLERINAILSSSEHKEVYVRALLSGNSGVIAWAINDVGGNKNAGKILEEYQRKIATQDAQNDSEYEENSIYNMYLGNSGDSVNNALKIEEDVISENIDENSTPVVEVQELDTIGKQIPEDGAEEEESNFPDPATLFEGDIGEHDDPKMLNGTPPIPTLTNHPEILDEKSEGISVNLENTYTAKQAKFLEQLKKQPNLGVVFRKAIQTNMHETQLNIMEKSTGFTISELRKLFDKQDAEKLLAEIQALPLDLNLDEGGIAYNLVNAKDLARKNNEKITNQENVIQKGKGKRLSSEIDEIDGVTNKEIGIKGLWKKAKDFSLKKTPKAITGYFSKEPEFTLADYYNQETESDIEPGDQEGVTTHIDKPDYGKVEGFTSDSEHITHIVTINGGRLALTFNKFPKPVQHGGMTYHFYTAEKELIGKENMLYGIIVDDEGNIATQGKKYIKRYKFLSNFRKKLQRDLDETHISSKEYEGYMFTVDNDGDIIYTSESESTGQLSGFTTKNIETLNLSQMQQIIEQHKTDLHEKAERQKERNKEYNKRNAQAEVAKRTPIRKRKETKNLDTHFSTGIRFNGIHMKKSKDGLLTRTHEFIFNNHDVKLAILKGDNNTFALYADGLDGCLTIDDDGSLTEEQLIEEFVNTHSEALQDFVTSRINTLNEDSDSLDEFSFITTER